MKELTAFVEGCVRPFMGIPLSQSPLDETRAMMRMRIMDLQHDCDDLQDVEVCESGDLALLILADHVSKILGVGVVHVTFHALSSGGRDWLEKMGANDPRGLTVTVG